MVPPAAAAARSPSPPRSSPAAWRVEVFRRADRDDPAGEHAAAALAELGLPPAGRVRAGRGVLLSPRYAREAVERIAAELLADPVVDEVRIAAPGTPPPAPPSALHRILVAARPGVMDPVARTVEDLLLRLGWRPAAGGPDVATFRVLELSGALAAADLEAAAARVLANETIETVRIDREDLPYGGSFPAAPRGRVEVPLRAAGAEELAAISRRGQLSLSPAEMQAIQAHFRALEREPTACELETLAQTWSEHCKHKTFTGPIDYVPGPGEPVERVDNLLRSTIMRATRELARPWCVSVFADNAGIVEFDRGWDLAVKVETHNHPSAIDPYGGAGTGIGGVIRDVLGGGLGARPIANTDCFFVGPLDLPRDAVPRGTMHPRRILRGVVAGVRDYGNRMGIPTVSGGVWFDPRYVGNPLVFAGTVGILPHAAARKEVRPGDVIVAVGGRTGRDGIHGATFSSLELTEESETISSAAVQIGDPITEKRVLDCLLQARDRGLYRAVTDCGAGGFSSAVGEMGERCGADVELDRVPLKYEGLASHEIWVSEAQERMVLAVPPEKVEECRAVFAAEDVEATVIGAFTDSGRLVVRDGGEVVADLDMRFLHGGVPRVVRRAEWTPPPPVDLGAPRPADFDAAVLALLGAPDVASKEWIIRQYDHEVQGTSVVKPLVGVHGDGPSDAAVLRPLPDSDRGVAIACGANPRYGSLDPAAMAACAIDEALRNAVAVGGDPDRAVLLDNFAWGNCDRPELLGALVRAARACYEAAVAYGAPFVSGKDSLNNEYRIGGETLSIPPTLVVTCLAPVPDVRRAVTMDLKRAGNRLFLVGRTAAELGGSQLLLHLGREGGTVPRPDLTTAPALLRALAAAIGAGCVASCHDLSEGGLAVAAAEMALAGGLGARIDLGAMPADPLPAGFDPDPVLLFAESCPRFLVEVAPPAEPAFLRLLAGVPCARVGEVTAAPVFAIAGAGGAPLVRLAVDELRRAFQGGFQG
ncbi:MAG: phosphoribosylformylglycinamidine synthase subunit PurL [Planctomycetota bacterium]